MIPFFISLLLILILAIIIWGIVSLLNARKMGFPTCTSPYNDDAIEQAKDICRFLFSRLDDSGIYISDFSKKTGIFESTWDMASGKSYEIISLIRMCHLLGCEIVIRQIGTNDLEKREHTPDVFKEKVFKITNRRH